jgi:hypothetical protein
MIVFSIVVILLIGVVVFFHFVQGFFSAAISAMISVIAAVLAVSYHETVVNLLSKGTMADYAHPMVLCGLFAVVYLVLRVIFDAAVPGNVRIPSTIDKVGAILMGLVAGIYSVGIFTIAVQMLPFGPGLSFLGYSRYALNSSRSLIIPQAMAKPGLDTFVNDEMVDNTMDPDKEQHLWLPADDLVLATVYHLSDGGSLAGDRTLASIHPDYLQELFGERLGIQTGARRVALQHGTENPISVPDAYSISSMPCVDGEEKELRPTGYAPAFKETVKPGAGQELLIVRVTVSPNASDDTDSFFRFSTGSIRMVGQDRDGKWTNYYPIGIVERFADGPKIMLDKPDDFLFTKVGDSFDAAFLVDSSLLQGAKTGNKFQDGVFLSVKRFGNADLSGTDVKEKFTLEPSDRVLRNLYQRQVLKLPAPSAAGG